MHNLIERLFIASRSRGGSSESDSEDATGRRGVEGFDVDDAGVELFSDGLDGEEVDGGAETGFVG